MSHLRKCLMKIKQPNESLLEGAMKILAEQLGGQVVATVKDYYGGTVDVDFGVVAPGVRGFGVNIKDGALEIVGDDWGQGIRLEKFRNSLNQAYKQCAVILALGRMGYSTQVKELQEGLAILGVKA